MISAGIDCGAKNMKTVILKDGQIVGKAKVLTGFDLEKAVEDSLVQALKTAGISKDNVQRVCGTGSGKDSIKMAEDTIDDIKAMSKGANFFFPNTRTVADVGAEEGRAAKIDEMGNPFRNWMPPIVSKALKKWPLVSVTNRPFGKPDAACNVICD